MTLKDLTPGAENKEFTFDHAYQADCTQQQVYEDLGKPIIAQALEGYNGRTHPVKAVVVGRILMMMVMFGIRDDICIWTNWLRQNVLHDGWGHE